MMCGGSRRCCRRGQVGVCVVSRVGGRSYRRWCCRLSVSSVAIMVVIAEFVCEGFMVLWE